MSDQERIAELQATGTRLENDNRMLRAQLTAAKRILKFVLIDKPLAMELATTLGEGSGSAIRHDKEMLLLFQRIELLEKDAWTSTTTKTREFVEVAEPLLNEMDEAGEDEMPTKWLRDWIEAFKRVLPPK